MRGKGRSPLQDQKVQAHRARQRAAARSPDKLLPTGYLPALVARRFPQVSFACGYGSGVIAQASSGSKAPRMIDLILAVDASQDWHAANLRRNPGDYYWLSRSVLGADGIARVQRRYGARMWFNAMVRLEDGNSIKYGVVETGDLLRDLLEWETFYVAGRLQKPVETVEASSPDVAAALQTNRENALRAALLMLDGASTKRSDLLETIVGLSYAGDVRVGIAENPGKVKDIVAGSFRALDAMYIGPFPHLARPDGPAAFQPVGERDALIRGLPAPYSASTGPSDFAARLASVVRRSSASQSLKGLVTGGPGVALQYVAAKLRKRFAGGSKPS